MPPDAAADETWKHDIRFRKAVSGPRHAVEAGAPRGA